MGCTNLANLYCYIYLYFILTTGKYWIISFGLILYLLLYISSLTYCRPVYTDIIYILGLRALGLALVVILTIPCYQLLGKYLITA